MDSAQYDVLIVGAGNAGLCAAMSALELGAKVGILEKAPKAQRGGNSTLTSHMRFAFNNIEDLVPLMDDPSDQLIKDMSDKLPGRLMGTLVPAIAADTSKHLDPTHRDFRTIDPNLTPEHAALVKMMNGKKWIQKIRKIRKIIGKMIFQMLVMN